MMAIAGLVHFFDRYTLKRRRMEAVAQATFVSRTVIKHMAKVGVRHFRAHFRPRHEKTGVFLLNDFRAFQWLCKTRPACAGFKLVERAEQRPPRHYIHVNPGLM